MPPLRGLLLLHRVHPAEHFKMSAANADCCTVIKHKNIRPDGSFTLPITVRCGIFGDGSDGSRRLPLAEFLAKDGDAIRERNMRGVI
jgi:hypothetical protein